ncbi:MAG: 2-C-methyl-D-erythritol 4-phosphate cytidylyltransferase [Candidatus Margulisiibacteriota bacterium]
MNSVIIPAGGSGTRFSETESKLFYTLNEKTILETTVETFYNHHLIDEIIIPCPLNEHRRFEDTLIRYTSKLILCEGGKQRANSVYNAFQLTNKNAKNILIHDAARPNITPHLIEAIINELNHHPVVIPAISVTDTIKEVQGNKIIKTLNRNNLKAVQTPQGFHKSCLENAYLKTTDLENHTDEASIIESIGIQGKIIAGTPSNIKITHPNDLAILRLIFGM